LRVTLEDTITDEKYQKLIRQLVSASQQAGTTTTVTKVYSVRASEKDNVLVTLS